LQNISDVKQEQQFLKSFFGKIYTTYTEKSVFAPKYTWKEVMMLARNSKNSPQILEIFPSFHKFTGIYCCLNFMISQNSDEIIKLERRKSVFGLFHDDFPNQNRNLIIATTQIILKHRNLG
jgi:hypothetical protein